MRGPGGTDRRGRGALPGPAAVVAAIALGLAVAGGAGALPGSRTVDSGDIKAGAVKRGDQKADQRTEWALLELDSTPRILKQTGGLVVEADASGSGFATVRLQVPGRTRVPVAQTTSSGDPPARVAVCGGGSVGMVCGAPHDDQRHVFVSVGAPFTDANVNLTLLPK